MKSNEELNALKNEYNSLKAKLAELSDEELTQVTGGSVPPLPPAKTKGLIEGGYSP